MADITTHQLAELLIGIARAQQAIVEAAESQRAGFKGQVHVARQDHAVGPVALLRSEGAQLVFF